MKWMNCIAAANGHLMREMATLGASSAPIQPPSSAPAAAAPTTNQQQQLHCHFCLPLHFLTTLPYTAPAISTLPISLIHIQYTTACVLESPSLWPSAMTHIVPPSSVSTNANNGAARSLHKQLLCTQLTPLPPLPSYTPKAASASATLHFKATKKRKATDDSDRQAAANKKVTSTFHTPSPSSSYPIRSRLRRTNNTSTSSSSSSISTSPPSPSSPLSPLSGSRAEQQAAVVQSFPSRRYCAFPLSLYSDPAKGYGVRSTTAISRHSLICEYAGELLTSHQAHSREHQYTLDEEAGCYMFYFGWGGSDWCVDSTRVAFDDAVHLRLGYGRYINHSRVNANLYGRVIGVHGRPHLCFFAKRAIRVGEELLIDYGDRSRESREAFPWLRS